MVIRIDHRGEDTFLEIYDLSTEIYSENCLYRSLNGDTFIYALPDKPITKVVYDSRYDTVHLFIGTEDLNSTSLYPIPHSVKDPRKIMYNRLVSSIRDWFGPCAFIQKVDNLMTFEIA